MIYAQPGNRGGTGKFLPQSDSYAANEDLQRVSVYWNIPCIPKDHFYIIRSYGECTKDVMCAARVMSDVQSLGTLAAINFRVNPSTTRRSRLPHWTMWPRSSPPLDVYGHIDYDALCRSHELRGRSAQSPAAASVDTSAAHPQEASLLLSLPPELRNRIYEFVFGAGTIHIEARTCTASQPWLPYWSGAKRVTDSEASGGWYMRMKKHYSKSTYAICKNHDWESKYELSKQSAVLPAECYHESQNLPDPPRRDGRDQAVNVEHKAELLIGRYAARHEECQDAIAAFNVQEYNVVCPDKLTHPRIRDYCQKCRKLRRKLTKAYGSPTKGGLSKLHADSKLDLSILLVCRRIYEEAALLPYALYTFDVPGAQGAQQFADRVLTRRQAQAVERVHMDDSINGAEDLTLLVRSFPCLKKLELSPETFLLADGEQKQWAEFPKLSRLQSVEIVWSHDASRYHVEKRDRRRERSRLMERFLLSGSFKAGLEHLTACRDAIDAERMQFNDDGEAEDRDESVNGDS